MSNCQLHPKIFYYLFANIQKEICERHLLISFCGLTDEGIKMSGINVAAISRVKHPKLPLFFFSFLPLKTLLQKDEFGILSSPGTFFLRLPFEKKQFQNLLKKAQNEMLTIESDQWRAFSETACKILLSKSVSEIKHGNQNDLGRAIFPLRASATMVINSPDNSSFQRAFASALGAFKNYIRSSKIQEMIEWAELCNNSTDHFLKQVLLLSNKLRRIEDFNNCNNSNEINNMINDIDQLKGILRTI